MVITFINQTPNKQGGFFVPYVSVSLTRGTVYNQLLAGVEG